MHFTPNRISEEVPVSNNLSFRSVMESTGNRGALSGLEFGQLHGKRELGIGRETRSCGKARTCGFII
jgi:hypothetical protein